VGREGMSADDRGVAVAVLLLEEPAKALSCSHGLKEIPAGYRAMYFLWLSFRTCQGITLFKCSSEGLESPVLRRQDHIVVIEIEIRRLAWHLRPCPPNTHKLLRSLQRQGPKQPGIYNAKHGCIGAHS